jgi:hypothetical protein
VNEMQPAQAPTPRRKSATPRWAVVLASAVAIVAVAVLIFLLLRGNDDDASPGATATATESPETTEPTDGATGEPGETPTESDMPLKDPGDSRLTDGVSTAPTTLELEDGDYFGHLTGIDTAARTVSFDIEVMYTGQAAIDYLTANDPTAENPPPNDYIIVNQSTQVRTLPLAADARIWDWCYPETEEALGFQERTFAEWAAAPAGSENQTCGIGAALGHGWNEVYWFDVRVGEIKQIVGQYLP